MLKPPVWRQRGRTLTPVGETKGVMATHTAGIDMRTRDGKSYSA